MHFDNLVFMETNKTNTFLLFIVAYFAALYLYHN